MQFIRCITQSHIFKVLIKKGKNSETCVNYFWAPCGEAMPSHLNLLWKGKPQNWILFFIIVVTGFCTMCCMKTVAKIKKVRSSPVQWYENTLDFITYVISYFSLKFCGLAVASTSVFWPHMSIKWLREEGSGPHMCMCCTCIVEYLELNRK